MTIHNLNKQHRLSKVQSSGVAPWSFVDWYQGFGETSCVHLQDHEIFVCNYSTIQRHIE